MAARHRGLQSPGICTTPAWRLHSTLWTGYVPVSFSFSTPVFPYKNVIGYHILMCYRRHWSLYPKNPSCPFTCSPLIAFVNLFWTSENSRIHSGRLSFPSEMQCSGASPIFIISYYIGHSMVILSQNYEKCSHFYKILQIFVSKRHDYHTYQKMLVRLIKNFI